MSSIEDGFEQSELGRRLDQVISLGKISEVDLAKSLARVALDEDGTDGGIITDFLPWLEMRHGAVRSRFAPAVGERVVVCAIAGELGAGFILGGLPCTDKPAVWTDTKVGFDFGADASWSHDTASSASVLALPASGSLEIKVGAATSIRITDGVIELKVGGSNAIKITDGNIDVKSGAVKLGPAGSLKDVARKGDAVVNGVITGGSSAVKVS
jgi:phage baseplate assembly protein V